LDDDLREGWPKRGVFTHAASRPFVLQLIEVAVVAAMRAEGVKLAEIRRARSYFANTLGLEFPFAQAKFKTDGVDILLDMEGRDGRIIQDKLVAANHSGQTVWSEVREPKGISTRSPRRGDSRVGFKGGVGLA
jgi:hypothetical protein